MSPFIGAGDYETRIKRSQKFLTSGNKIKLSVKFQGRQMNHPEFGHNLIAKVKTDLQDFGTPEGEAKLIGKRLMLTFTPSKKSGGVKK
jgi:translation initiation factor IF-3